MPHFKGFDEIAKKQDTEYSSQIFFFQIWTCDQKSGNFGGFVMKVYLYRNKYTKKYK
jgi:hypothetical protein